MKMSEEFWEHVRRLEPSPLKTKDGTELPVLYGLCRIGEDSADISCCVGWRYPSMLYDTDMVAMHPGTPLKQVRRYRGL